MVVSLRFTFRWYIAFYRDITRKMYDFIKVLTTALFTDGAQFARYVTINAGNSHSWVEGDPHQVTPYHLQQKF